MLSRKQKSPLSRHRSNMFSSSSLTSRSRARNASAQTISARPLPCAHGTAGSPDLQAAGWPGKILPPGSHGTEVADDSGVLVPYRGLSAWDDEAGFVREHDSLGTV